MAENRQSGSGRNRQFGDERPGGLAGASGDCAECEAMLADAFDGTLAADEQAQFERHACSCERCGQMVADAQRGAAWLELLRDPAPAPPADLLERILAQTSAQTSWTQHPGDAGTVVPGALHPAGMASAAWPATAGNVIPFPRRAYAAVRHGGFAQVVLQPRLAMTAAMAFFSIALTMNITGVHATSLRASDFTPSSLRRDFFSANAHVVQYYEGLRVVYELESRVRDLQNTQDTDATDGASAAPAGSGQNPAEPGGQSPAGQPESHPAPANPSVAPAGSQPGGNRSRPPADPGTSRSDDVNRSRRVAVAERLDAAGYGYRRHARTEGRLV